MNAHSLLHRPRPGVFFAAVLLLSLHPLHGQAPDSQTFRVGATSIAIPPPAGLTETGSDYRVLLEFLAPDNNRLVAAFVLPDDWKVLHGGNAPPMSTYALAEVPRRAEFADISPEFFQQVIGTVSQQFGAMVDGSLKDQQDSMNRKLQALGSDSGTITLDKPVQLGQLFSMPDAYGFGMIMPVSAKGATTKMVMVMSVMRVRNRLLFAYFYSVFKDPGTVQSIRDTTEQWTRAILAANK